VTGRKHVPAGFTSTPIPEFRSDAWSVGTLAIERRAISDAATGPCALSDIPDLHSVHIDVMDHDVAMLQPGKVALVPHAALLALMERHPRIAAALWRCTLIDAAIFRQWMVGMGRKSAYARVAHLLCELVVLARAVDLGAGGIDHLPTQEELGDALGLSVVHVNRTMRTLREDKLIETRGKRLTILDWSGLSQAAGFSPSYLHLGRSPWSD
jgi:hypothetical protein